MSRFNLNFLKTPGKIALDAMWRHKVRAALTILGITVGITAVIVVLSAGRAIEDFIVGQVTMFGTDYINVEVKVPSTEHVSSENVSSMAQGVTVTTLKEKDAEELKKIANVRDVYSGQTGQAVFSYQDQNKVTLIFGVTESFDAIDSGELDEGRFFTDAEDKSLARVVVLGSSLKEKLFGDEDAVGKQIKIKKQSYRVIGVMKERGGAGIFSFDDIAFLPLQTLQKLILGIDYVQFIYLQVENTALTDVTVDDVTVRMRELHKIDDPTKDDFAVMSAAEGLALLGTITGAIKILLFALASISLVVGGVGIMNVMYVAVAERTFEIGLRKAIGAKSRDILSQFLAEAVVITFLGGIAGIAIGTGLSYLVSVVANSFGYAWKFHFSPQYILLAVGVSVLVGIISGIYPARTAARLEPIVALKRE
ncbi:ABC transporter permease [Patescibacteria group bacterium]|nr:ABC transporter permease [Patescibacteria group bacterium]